MERIIRNNRNAAKVYIKNADRSTTILFIRNEEEIDYIQDDESSASEMIK